MKPKRIYFYYKEEGHNNEIVHDPKPMTMSHHFNRSVFFHVVAVLTVGVWGTTFIATKILLNHGLNPASVFFYRFLLAYILMLWVGRKEPWFADNWRDELKAVGLGLGGGSLYFLTENTALYYTLSTQVAFILCTAPLFTAILIGLFAGNLKKTFNPAFVTGTVLALGGVALVIFNGSFVLHLSPKGDLLCLAAALCWGFYTLLLRDMEKRYSTLFLTRKVFAYGLLTILPYFLYEPLHGAPETLTRPIVWGNLLFLGVVASMVCYLSWNKTVRELGALTATPYIYLSPIFTSVASALILHEPLSGYGMAGALCIIVGVWGAASGFRLRPQAASHAA